MPRHRPTDDARAIGKIYPMDRHGPGHPHHDAKPLAHEDRSLGGKPARLSDVEKVRPGGDPTDRINRLYGYGRHYPHRAPHDRPRQDLAVPEYLAPSHHEPAHFHQATRHEHISPAASEQPPQFTDSKHGESYDNDASGWVRGMGGQSPHPHFDSGPSGHRYSRK